MAPPYRSSFSVNVVFPASGWLMIAKVLRRAISLASAVVDFDADGDSNVRLVTRLMLLDSLGGPSGFLRCSAHRSGGALISQSCTAGQPLINPRTRSAPDSGSCIHDRDRDGDLDTTGVDEIADRIFLFENPGR